MSLHDGALVGDGVVPDHTVTGGGSSQAAIEPVAGSDVVPDHNAPVSS